MNITTCHEDLLRFRDRADLESFYLSYGLEGLEAGEDARGILSPDHTIGVHLSGGSICTSLSPAPINSEFGRSWTGFSRNTWCGSRSAQTGRSTAGFWPNRPKSWQ